MRPSDRFAINLKGMRRFAGISQRELGARCKMHRTEISLLEGGKREPRLGTIVKLAAALDVSVESLLSGMAWDEESQSFVRK